MISGKPPLCPVDRPGFSPASDTVASASTRRIVDASFGPGLLLLGVRAGAEFILPHRPDDARPNGDYQIRNGSQYE